MSKNWHLRLVLWSRVTYKDCTFLVGVCLCIVLLLAQPPKHAAPHALRDRVWLRMGGLPLPCRWTLLRSSWRKHTCYESSSATAAPCSSTVFDLSCCVRVHHDRHYYRLFCLYLCVSQFLKGTTLWCGTAAPLIEIKLKEYQTAKTAV